MAHFAQFWAPKFFFVVLPLPDVRNCYKLSLYAISRETNESNLRKWQIVSGPILAYLAQIWATIFFFKNLPSSVTRYHGQLSSYAISEETNDRILRKVSDRWTGRETDESDFIGRCLTNVERLIE